MTIGDPHPGWREFDVLNQGIKRGEFMMTAAATGVGRPTYLHNELDRLRMVQRETEASISRVLAMIQAQALNR